jgi:hypothetical protein
MAMCVFFAVRVNLTIMRVLNDMHEINARLAKSVCTCQIEKRWTDLHEICYEPCNTGDCPKIVLYYFRQLVITTWQAKKLVS